MIWNHACHSYSKLWYRINTKQWREGNFQKCNIWISSHLDPPNSLSSWVINNLLFTYCIVSISNPCVGFGVPLGLEECGVTAMCTTGTRTRFLSERWISTSKVQLNITLKCAFTNNFITTSPEHKVRGLNCRESVELQVSNCYYSQNAE
jgi:hypothetical protein